MNLQEALKLDISSKSLAKEVETTSRQIRKMRKGRCSVPEKTVSDDKIEILLRHKKEKDEKRETRKELYEVEDRLLVALESADDEKIEEILKLRSELKAKGIKEGVRIWNPREEDCQVLLGQHNQRVALKKKDEATKNKPSDSLRERMQQVA